MLWIISITINAPTVVFLILVDSNPVLKTLISTKIMKGLKIKNVPNVLMKHKIINITQELPTAKSMEVTIFNISVTLVAILQLIIAEVVPTTV